MSQLKVSGALAAVTALALSVSAYGDTGKSPNGPPGPVGNPNQPAAQPQANGPQGPAGNESHGKSNSSHGKSSSSHGKSNSSHGKSGASHGKSNASHGNSRSSQGTAKSHANPSPGTPRKGGREDRPAGKITICHATKSHTNPYVAITISVNGLNGHGPAEDPHHHAGSWKDIIPAPNQDAKDGGCPTTVQSSTDTKQETTSATPIVTPAPEVAALAPAATTAPATGEQAVLGVQAHGTSPAAAPGASKVLGETASGTTAPKAALAVRAANDEGGSLPFTGFELAVILLAAAAALLGGFALRRATAHRS